MSISLKVNVLALLVIGLAYSDIIVRCVSDFTTCTSPNNMVLNNYFCLISVSFFACSQLVQSIIKF